ncbi:hypothetical protein METBIDRAFT_76625 [Metschnikowia bicuspidata var. bicuspidata NRRL YB-4993]|uniref:PNPLA domain-containing protein n=1 Tax=Metschnikowia bicuspidata var. bicuspidata NRRL YB-4993 TaxID=869754 RepID=A0A1A0HI12_9ASCO|nr:hypothetical protein METBIDRAFT_76625 [Metschnikowia bicuspidata var. bicuspidata NRRL YB-4993]OBA23641.1 hypothetical protein METBIDRAFT_76625 [Metschnikowia bicuspidata var. bicuspidata NRRL YB-4993]
MLRQASAIFVLPVLTFVVNHIPTFIWVLIDFMLDIWMFWFKKLYNLHRQKDDLKEALKVLQNVQNYHEFKDIVAEIDRLTNMDLWRQNFVSQHYDYLLIDDRMSVLKEARLDGDTRLMMSLLRSGLIRNFAGIAQKKLYTKSYLGTKFKIQEYILEVLDCLNYLNESINSEPEDDFIMNSKQLKINFFHDARQSFGCTALILQGGSLFGLCHLGVVRALYFRGLLPRVIGGSAIGAAVASLVCTLPENELNPVLVSITGVMGNVDQLNHDVDERYGNVIENVVRKGYSQDILIFLKFVRDTIGDMTFEEAYLRTQRILNIVVHPTHLAIPTLLNYITAPNVIIWTAIYASIGTGVLSDNVQLYVKGFKGDIVPIEPNQNISFLKPQDATYLRQYFRSSVCGEKTSSKNSFTRFLDKTSPYTRLTELFNVNHFINSLARPYLAPLINNDLKHHNTYGRVKSDTKVYDQRNVAGWHLEEGSPKLKLSVSKMKQMPQDAGFTLSKHVKNVVGMELQHRLELLNKFGLLPEIVKRLCIDEKPTNAQMATSLREITVVPELRYLLRDFGRVFDVHRTLENIPYWILVGERSVWPLFPLLWSRCAIEYALDDLYNIHKQNASIA